MPKREAFFEYYYHTRAESEGPRKLVVSFPGRLGLRLYEDHPHKHKPFLWDAFCRCNADVLLLRPVYEGLYLDAYITKDFGKLPAFLHTLRKQKNIEKTVLFGFSLGCAPVLWLSRQGVADEVILLAPGLPMLDGLRAMDDPRWSRDFGHFCDGKPLEMSAFPANANMKIIYGSNYRYDRMRDGDMAHFLLKLAPHASVEIVDGAGHDVVRFWSKHGTLCENIYAMLGLTTSTSNYAPPHQTAVWSALERALDGAHPPQNQQRRHTSLNMSY